MNKTQLLVFFVLSMTICLEGKKFSWGRGSTGRRTSYKPAPTSLSHAQPSAPKPSQAVAPKPSLFAWQEKPRQATAASKQTKPTQTHSYPSSGTGLSGNNKAPSPRQESAQKSHTYPQNTQQSNANQQNHAYPASPGLSGSSGSGSSYPQQTGGGLSGNSKQAPPPYPGQTNAGLSGAAPPPYPGTNTNYNGRAQPPPYSNNGYSGVGGGAGYPPNNYGSGYHHPQGPPPAYSNYGGYGSHHQSVGPQMPGYFGNYGGGGYGQGFGGVSRTGSALRGVGIAGAGIGTVLTGLALWNLARSTGRHHHTVIYDNKGQPVAVAPSNDTAAVVDHMLADLVNCSLTIDSGNATEVLAIPCAIASSFSPDATVEDLGVNSNATDNTKCIVSVLTKSGKEYMTTIPCSVLLNTAAENNVTEPPVVINDGVPVNDTVAAAPAPGLIDEKPLEIITPPSALALSTDTAKLNCTSESGELRDPINPCFAVTTDLSVIPLKESTSAAPAA